MMLSPYILSLRHQRFCLRFKELRTLFARTLPIAVIVLFIQAGTTFMTPTAATAGQTSTGAEELLLSGFGPLDGKRVGLITNQTGLVGETHLADILSDAPNVTLAAIYAPEHGFRGLAEAGAKVRNSIDKRTGTRVLSLYGKTKKPSRKMLKGIDVLVFDIQDIGVRYYTYISTMGLAMQAAAEANIPFVVLDRPNPLGGEYVSGYVLEKRHTSFVGQFPVPIVHGLTVGELAEMINGER